MLLHALGDNAADSATVGAALEPDHRVVTMDLRGHGASGWPGDYSFELMRDDVIRVLDDLAVENDDPGNHDEVGGQCQPNGGLMTTIMAGVSR
jgi:pimeloyl-ACP methyl ester carboxylesterase